MPLCLSDTAWSYLESANSIPLRNGTPKDWKSFVPHIAFLSEHLSHPNLRSKLIREKYLDQPDLHRAYRLYFMTTNLLKIHPVLDELSLYGFFDEHPSLRILDLGSGTGTMLAGLLTWLEKRKRTNSVYLTAVDHSSKALQEMKSSFESFWNVPVRSITTDLYHPFNWGETFDLILAGNVLNEISAQSLDFFSGKCRQHLSDRGTLICIEPALKETSRTLLHFRDAWIQSGGSVVAPCCTQIPCPALFHPDDWCHHDVPWERPDFIRYFDEQIGLIKKSLKFSYMILTRQNVLRLDAFDERRDYRRCYRVVSELFNEKGRYRIYLCNDHGRRLFEKNKRDESPLNHALNSLRRYDMVYIEEPLDSGKIGKIQPHTCIRKIREGWLD